MVGLTLAIALAQAGTAVACIDAESPATATGAAFDGRASALALSSRRLLEGIGVWPRLAGDATPIEDIRVSEKGSLLFLH